MSMNWMGGLNPEKQRSKLPQNKATMVNRPPASLINERPPFRVGTAPRLNLLRQRHLVDSFGGGVAVVGGSGAE